MKNIDKETMDAWHKNPKYWKWGMFYYNKEDERMVVDKCNPNFGSTINFAHRKSYLFLIGMLIFFGFVTFVILRD